MPFRNKFALSFVTVLVLSLILSVRAGTASTQFLFPPLGGEFGNVTDIQGNIAAIGYPIPAFPIPSHKFRGLVYILERGPTGWQLVKTLLTPAVGGRLSRFGSQITISGNRLAIGDTHLGDFDLSAGHTGRVYVYEKQGSIWPDLPAYTIEPSEPLVHSFGETHAFSGEYLAVTDLVSYDIEDSGKSLVRVRAFRLHNGEATLLGTIERKSEHYFGFEMSMNGSELAILSLRRGLLIQPKQGEVLLYDLSGGTMKKKASLPIPMKKGEVVDMAKVSLEEDRLMVTKITPTGCGVVFFKRTEAGWRASSELRPLMPNEYSDYLVDMKGNALVINSNLGTDLYSASTPPRFVRRLESGITDGLATSSDTAMIVRSDQVSFTSLQSLVAADSVVVDPSQASPPGGSTHLGELVVGQTCNVEVELQNAGTEPLQLTGVQITPVLGANSVTGHSFTPVTLPSLNKTRVKLTLNPPTAGSYCMSLVVLHPDAEIAPYSYSLDFEAKVGDFAPFVLDSAESQLIAKGEPVKLQADTIGPRGRFNCQWYKDNRVLTGSTQPFLYIPSAQPAHAGRYRLDVWSTGSLPTSCTMALGVFERKVSTVIAGAGDSLSFTARFWGPDIRVRWLRSLNGLPGDPAIPVTWATWGTNSATLNISSPMALTTDWPLRISAELTMDESATAISNGHTIELIKVPFIAVSGTRYGQVGNDFPPMYLSDVRNHYDAVLFSAEGLPPGLRLPRNSSIIEGVPTRAGNYSVKIMAKNRYGSAVPYRLNLKIYSATDQPVTKLHFGSLHQAAGIAMIPESSREDPAMPGLIQIQSTYGAGFSGHLAVGNVRRPFSGKWRVNDEYGARSATLRLSPFLGYRSVVLNLYQSALDEGSHSEDIEAILTLQKISPNADSAEIYSYLEPLIHLSKEWRHVLAGRYSFLLGGLEGQGYGSFSVGSDFHTTGVGTLADGTSFTFSMPMVKGQNEPLNGTVMMVRLGSGPVRLWGHIDIMASGAEEAGLVNGTLTMVRPARPGARLLPDGYETSVTVRGARYYTPKKTPLFTSPDSSVEQAGRAIITLAADGLPEYINTAVTFTQAGKVIVDKPNPSGLELDVYMPTGFFTGRFTAKEAAPGTENRFVRRTVNFSGMIVPQLRTGGGFFHYSPLPDRFAKPPTTISTTPIYIRGVTLE